MAEIKTPQALIDIAKQYGVNLDSTIKYDAESALQAISAFFNGEDSDMGCFGADSDFGFGFKMPKLKAAVQRATASAKLKTQMRMPMPRPPVKVFSVSAKLNPLQALGAADQLLGSTSITNRPQVIKATQALASLGNQDAIRGLATIATAAQIRAKTHTPPGKKAITHAPAVMTSKVAKPYTKAAVFNLAQAKLNADARTKANLTFVQRIKKFFGFKL